MAGTQLELSENSLQNLLYKVFCRLVFVETASGRDSLTRHVEDHGPAAVDARLAEETRHRVVGDGGGGDGGVDRAVGRFHLKFL